MTHPCDYHSNRQKHVLSTIHYSKAPSAIVYETKNTLFTVLVSQSDCLARGPAEGLPLSMLDACVRRSMLHNP